MELTRSEAINLAVRRWMRTRTTQQWEREDMDAGIYQPCSLGLRAIRAHFQAICRAYTIIPDWPKCAISVDVWRKIYQSDAMTGDATLSASYDGHTLRH